MSYACHSREIVVKYYLLIVHALHIVKRATQGNNIPQNALIIIKYIDIFYY